MKTAPTLACYAFMVTNRHGHSAPLVIGVSPKAAGSGKAHMTTPMVNALERLIQTTGFERLLSFLVEHTYLEFMEARAQFVLQTLYDEEEAILMVHCDSERALRAFVSEVRKTHEVKPTSPAATRPPQPADADAPRHVLGART